MFALTAKTIWTRRFAVAVSLSVATVIFSTAAPAATPFPLAPCAIGAQRLNADTTLALTRRAIARAFPHANYQDSAGTDRDQRHLAVREGGETLMIVSYYPRTPGHLLAQIRLLSPRFELLPGVRPGIPLSTAARALGPIQLSYAPDIGIENLRAPGLAGTLARWEGKGCVVNLRLGSGQRVGLYASGATETHRYRQGAAIREIELTF